MRTVLITGGQGGLGRALAEAFRAAGGYAVLAPGRAELDVRDPAAVEAFFRPLPRLDALICNAGVAENALMAKLTPESWDHQLEVNLRGAFLCARAAIPLLEESGAGHIIAIGSHTALVGNAGQTAYGAAKAGLVGLVQSLAQELGPRNIRVNCVLPGLLRTKMTQDLSESVWSAALAQHTLDRLNEPAEAARFIHYLDSALPHTSSQVFQLDSRVTPWA